MAKKKAVARKPTPAKKKAPAKQRAVPRRKPPQMSLGAQAASPRFKPEHPNPAAVHNGSNTMVFKTENFVESVTNPVLAGAGTFTISSCKFPAGHSGQDVSVTFTWNRKAKPTSRPIKSGDLTITIDSGIHMKITRTYKKIAYPPIDHPGAP